MSNNFNLTNYQKSRKKTTLGFLRRRHGHFWITFAKLHQIKWKLHHLFFESRGFFEKKCCEIWSQDCWDMALQRQPYVYWDAGTGTGRTSTGCAKKKEPLNFCLYLVNRWIKLHEILTEDTFIGCKCCVKNSEWSVFPNSLTNRLCKKMRISGFSRRWTNFDCL